LKDSDSAKHQDILTATTVTTVPKKRVLFSSKGHNMQYFDMEGIKQRTSYSNVEDLYTAVVKELFDNEADWLHDNYKDSINETITAVITISKDKVNYRFRNSNPKNIEIEAFHPGILSEIFDFNKTYGSKQNLHVFGRRGLFGDASKLIGGIPYAIIHSQGSNNDNAFYNTQWKIPIYFRSNGVERQVLIEVNRAASIANVYITESSDPVPFIDTEIEVTIPIIKSDADALTDKIYKFCNWYRLFTRDISFKIQVINETVTPHHDVKIVEVRAVEPIQEKSELPSVKTYTPDEFVRFFLGFEDRENTTVYEVLTELKEGTQTPKKEFDSIVGGSSSNVFNLSLAEFLKDPNYESKMKSFYHTLREKSKKRLKK
jgi:hypothetical protein